MSDPTQGSPKRLDQSIEAHPLRGGLVGIALVTLATLAVAVAGAVICVLALVIIG